MSELTRPDSLINDYSVFQDSGCSAKLSIDSWPCPPGKESTRSNPCGNKGPVISDRMDYNNSTRDQLRPAANQEWSERNRDQVRSERVEREPQEFTPRNTNTPHIDTTKDTKDAPITSKDLSPEELKAIRERLIDGLNERGKDADARNKIESNAQRLCQEMGFGDCTLEYSDGK